MTAPFGLWRISAAGQPTQSIARCILAGKNEMDARHRDSSGFVDRDDAGMGMRRTQHEGVHHAGRPHVVNEMSASERSRRSSSRASGAPIPMLR